MVRSDEEHQARERWWVERIRMGDEHAFRSLFDFYYDPLCDFAERYIRSAADAEDLVQLVFISIWERHADWSPRGSLRAYLYAAVRYKIARYFRDHHDRWILDDDQLDETLSDSDPEEDLRSGEIAFDLAEAIEALPERRKLIYLLSRQHGLTYAEISQTLGISVKTVETQIGRALKSLRNFLRHHLVMVFCAILLMMP